MLKVPFSYTDRRQTPRSDTMLKRILRERGDWTGVVVSYCILVTEDDIRYWPKRSKNSRLGYKFRLVQRNCLASYNNNTQLQCFSLKVARANSWLHS